MNGARPSLRTRLLARTHVESIGDLVFKGFAALVALAALLVFVLVIGVLIQRAMPAIREFGLGFLWGREWDPDGQRFGALPYIAGTLASSLLALVFAVPVAIGTAVALTEILDRRLSNPLGILVELLAAVPSIIFGIWGLAVVVPFVKNIGPRDNGQSVLAAALVLAVMILPIITAITRDMFRAVPRAQREAALALGLTRWEVTWHVVLPHARGGTIAAVLLGFGRALGETMAVIMVIGTQPLLPHSVFDPGYTISAIIANEFGDPSGSLHFPALVELGLVLLAASLVINLAARYIVVRYTRKIRGAKA